MELALLEELGFGLDLTQCAATGGNDQLTYVSPKSGRAVSASAGEPYKDKLLALPQFLARSSGAHARNDDIRDGLAFDGLLPRHARALAARRSHAEVRLRLAERLGRG